MRNRPWYVEDVAFIGNACRSLPNSPEVFVDRSSVTKQQGCFQGPDLPLHVTSECYRPLDDPFEVLEESKKAFCCCCQVDLPKVPSIFKSSVVCHCLLNNAGTALCCLFQSLCSCFPGSHTPTGRDAGFGLPSLRGALSFFLGGSQGLSSLPALS